jgi:SP family sugar:H+ symporter-like MFS transporter
MVSAKYGRRMTVFTMSLWALCAATIVITAQNKTHMLISRVLNYIYVVSASDITTCARGFLFWRADDRRAWNCL